MKYAARNCCGCDAMRSMGGMALRRRFGLKRLFGNIRWAGIANTVILKLGFSSSLHSMSVYQDKVLDFQDVRNS